MELIGTRISGMHCYTLVAFMIIAMSKIGTILDSRPAGREVWLGMRPSLPADPATNITVDFQGVHLLTPSFADEFITNLLETFPRHVRWENVRPGSVIARTLKFLEPEWRERQLLPLD